MSRQKARILLLVLAVSALATAAVLLPIRDWTIQLAEWARGTGALGVTVFIRPHCFTTGRYDESVRPARVRAIDAAVAREGFKLVLLLRLSPLFPFNVLNYALSLSRVGLPTYVSASFLGMLPWPASLPAPRRWSRSTRRPTFGHYLDLPLSKI